jgi:hypothetical protein
MKLPRFALRELFLLVVIAAMGCGWWREKMAKQAACDESAQARQNAASYERSAKHWRGTSVSMAKFAKELAGLDLQVTDENGNRIDTVSGKLLTPAEYK